VFKEFVHYDFEKALQLPPELKGTFDRIIVDPPFLSDDCQTKGWCRINNFFLSSIVSDYLQLP